MFHWLVSAGRPTHARLSRWRGMANRILNRAVKLESLTDAELLKRGRELRWYAKTGRSLSALLPEAYALVVESSRRNTGLKPYPVQVMGAVALFEGGVAEMQTGEGKTLTAVLPVFLRALPGLGCHIVTVNDYLARRDAETMGPIYQALGLSVGCIQAEMESEERRNAYALDVTYGTAKEMGFDFLRDRLRMGAAAQGQSRFGSGENGDGEHEPLVQRGNHFALVDEADSVLIDEARTPLIIGLTQPQETATVNLFRWCFRATGRLTPSEDFVFEPKRRSAYLTDTGCRRVLMMNKPSLLDSIDTERIYKHVEQSLVARYGFQQDRDYVVSDDRIVIVDESTGRMMEGRTWQDGLHQAVEAKEHVPITAATGQAARITVQNFFRQYTHIAGMTGTAVQAAREVKKTYGLHVTPIPTHRPCIRRGRPYRIFKTMQVKREAILEEVEQLVETGRAILIGTPSVEASEALGALLKRSGINPQVLNARFHEQEAEIVRRAGQSRRVTIATNMAGRGTDIKLTDSVREAGGLHVIATEMHSSARIDRQLIGRAARQGDPGSYHFFLSLEDELLRCLDSQTLERVRRNAQPNSKGELPRSWLKFFKKTQRLLEKNQYKQRKQLLKQEKQRIDLYRRMGLDPYLELTE